MNFPLRHALVTGVGGQDGALLAAHLLERGVAVTGTHRPRRAFDDWRLRELGIDAHPRLRVVELDPADAAACSARIADAQPDVVFHLAGQSRVAESFRDPRGSIEANGASTAMPHARTMKA